MKKEKIPEATILRLSVYSRYLESILEQNIHSVSSGDIAHAVGGTPAQVRKDLAYFGDFGTRGVGYSVDLLNEAIRNILGLQNPWKTILIGGGNLGAALTHFPGFRQRGFEISAVFDNDIKKVGLSIHSIPIHPITEMVEYIDVNNIDFAINTVPAYAADQIASLLSNSKIRGVLNFSPRTLKLREDIINRDVDLTVNMELLSFMAHSREINTI